MNLRKIFVMVFFLSGFAGMSQTVVNNAFKSGEKLTLIGSYYMSSLWTDLVEIKMEVHDVPDSKVPLYRLAGTAKTYSSWDNYFKIRDSYQSWITPTTGLPVIFKRDMDEGGYTKDEKYVFKRKSLQVTSTEKKKNGTIRNNTVAIKANTHDLVSMVYYVRMLPYSTYKLNQTVVLNVIIDEKLENITIKYKGTENINVGKYGSKKCHKIGISIGNQKIVKTKETNNVWLTADANCVPVLIKADIPVGSIQIRLSEMTGLKN